MVIPGKGEEMIWVLPHEQQKLLKLLACYFKGSLFSFSSTLFSLAFQDTQLGTRVTDGDSNKSAPSSTRVRLGRELTGRAAGASSTRLQTSGRHQDSSACLGNQKSLQSKRWSHLHNLLQSSMLKPHWCPQAHNVL